MMIMQPAQPRPSVLSAEQFEALAQLDTCTAANAIERFGVRPRDEGFAKPGLHCVTGGCPRVLGYAATFKVRTANAPMTGEYYMEHSEWWGAIAELPAPRIAVLQDIDTPPGRSGAVVGEVRTAVLKVFGCAAAVTNGAVRDIPTVAAMGFPMFAPHVALSHSYAHLVQFGGAVEILGLAVRSGDLLLADCHGLLSIPAEIAAEIPAMASRIVAWERRVVEACQRPDFSQEKLLAALNSGQKDPADSRRHG